MQLATPPDPLDILVVDDEPAIADLVADILAEAGHSARIAHSVPAARTLLAAAPPDLIVSDIILGGETGNDLLREVKAARPDTIVLLMTGFASVERVIDALQHGADDFLLKPFRTPDLIAAIDRAIARAGDRREAARLRSIEAIHALGVRLAGETTIHAISHALIDAARDATGADRLSVLVYDESTDQLELAAVWDRTADFQVLQGTRLARTDSLAWRALDGQHTLLVDSASADGHSAVLQHPEWGAAIIHPIVHAGQPLGVLNLAKTAPAGRFSRADADVSAILGGSAALALRNVHRVDDLRTRLLQTIGALADMLEARDTYTRGHSERVAQYAVAFAEVLGLADREVEAIRFGALLHDIGKVGIYDSLIRSSSRLTDDEWDQMRAHPTIGANLLRSIADLDQVIPIVECHHERWDGQGYPNGWSGETIPFPARLVTICDSFDAMTSARSYNEPLSLSDALHEIEAGRGTQFDPALVDVFLPLAPRIFDPGGKPLAPLFSRSRVDYQPPGRPRR